MKHLRIDNQLFHRTLDRDGDIDYFIDTAHNPIHIMPFVSYLSRIQFPNARAILIRTSPTSMLATVHILGDTDLYSSFTNYELDLSNHILTIDKTAQTVLLSLQPIT